MGRFPFGNDAASNVSFFMLIFLELIAVQAIVSFNEKVQGVNIGGWLVGEPWITPSLFETHNVTDEYRLGEKLGQEKGFEYLKKHWDTFYTETDFAVIANWGINLIRIPVGYWAFDPDHKPYIKGSVDYLDKAIVWARKYNLKVLIDLHGAKGSQNGFDNSGRAGVAEWDPKSDETPKIIEMIAQRYKNDQDTVVAIQCLNEPAPWMLKLKRKEIAVFYRNAYKKVRDTLGDNSTQFWVHDAFTNYNNWKGDFLQPKYRDVVLDSHHYVVFNPGSIKDPVDCHIANVCRKGYEASKYMKHNLFTVFGEWCGAMTDCTKHINGYQKGSRFNGTFGGVKSPAGNCADITIPIAQWSEKRKDSTRRFIEAQLDAYESAGGWMFWTAKTEGVPGTDFAWDMGALIEHGVFPQPFSDRKFKKQCTVFAPLKCKANIFMHFFRTS